MCTVLRRLLQAIEGLLVAMGIPYLTTPAMGAVAVPVWKRSLGFAPIKSASELEALELR
jgi:hypothetical protein